LFEKNCSPPPKFHTPRPEHSITFYLKDPQKYSFQRDSTIFTYPVCVINGLYTIPIYRHGSNDFLAIKVILQPTAFYILTGMTLKDLTNNYIDAEDIWGNKIKNICEKLLNEVDLQKRIEIIEEFLENQIALSKKNIEPIDKVSSAILLTNKHLKIENLADLSCLSIRQFIRKFEERVGVSAKTYTRIIQFDRTFRMKNQNNNLNWLDIALLNNYYDYQHLAKDYKEFTSLTPPVFFEIEKKSPERTFGLVEI
jgi:AraC-like DNA-binding protein